VSATRNHLTPYGIAVLLSRYILSKYMPIKGTATIMVVSASDGTTHPDATVTPPTGQMTNGFLQMQLTLNAVSSLAGYTLKVKGS
jgi:hypothetical protein